MLEGMPLILIERKTSHGRTRGTAKDRFIIARRLCSIKRGIEYATIQESRKESVKQDRFLINGMIALV